MAVPPVLQNPDPLDIYTSLFNALDDAYWEASDIMMKDMVHGVEMEIGEIVKAIGEQQLKDNTAVFTALGQKIKATNDALKKIQAQIDSITKNIKTAATVLSLIAKVLAMFPV